MQDDPRVTIVPATDESEDDSAFGDDEIRSYTTSVSSSVERYIWEHGRRFHSYREGAYNFPNDEGEQDRLDLNHHICLQLMDDKLHYAPLDKNKPLRILDLGTGTGIWAMDLADQYTNAEVIGNDLSPIQPKWVPPNVQFEVDDVESPWPPRRPFDYIHARYMLGAISDWPKLVQQAYDQLQPGGWIELQDFNTLGYTEDGSEGPNNKFIEFCKVFADACTKIGKNPSPGQHLKGWVEKAGFQNIQSEIHKCPVGMWPKDPKMKKIGALYQINLTEVLEAALVGLLTRVEGWKIEEVQVFIAEIKADMKRKSTHIMQEFHCVWAQKPLDAPAPQ